MQVELRETEINEHLYLGGVELNSNIKELIERLRSYQTYALLEPDRLNPLDIVLDCVAAADELERAYMVNNETTPADISKPSQSSVEPEKQLFEYSVVDNLTGRRTFGVVKTDDTNDAARIVNYYCTY